MGFKMGIVGLPNVGKSTLFNALVESEAAIISSIAGTTRDVIERNVAMSGIPFSFVDTAGLRDRSEDSIERIGIDRAKGELERADLVLWLGSEGEGPSGAWEIAARSDADDFVGKTLVKHSVSARTGEGLEYLKKDLLEAAQVIVPKPGEALLNARQREHVRRADQALERAISLKDLLLIGEELRSVRVAFDQLIGKSTTEDMLDALFGRVCIGK